MSKVAQLIDSVKSEAESDKSRAQRELEERRSVVLERIGQAAENRGFDLENPGVIAMLQARLAEAHGLRISHAEALADLAEQGDFVSPVKWWELYNENDDQRANRGSATLWKGYVIAEFLLELVFDADSAGRCGINADERSRDQLTIMLRKACNGGHVAAVRGRKGYAVGRAVGRGGFPKMAVERAYRAYFEGLASELPVELEQQLVGLQGMDEDEDGPELDNNVGNSLV